MKTMLQRFVSGAHGPCRHSPLNFVHKLWLNAEMNKKFLLVSTVSKKYNLMLLKFQKSKQQPEEQQTQCLFVLRKQNY